MFLEFSFLLLKKIILKSLTDIVFISESIPLIFCLFFLKRIKTKALKVFFIYLLLHAVLSIFGYKYGTNVETYCIYISLLRVHLILEFLLLSYFFYNIIISKLKNYLLIIAPFFLALVLFDYFKFGNETFSSLPTLTEYIVFIIAIIVYLYDVMSKVNAIPIYTSLIFWISVGLLISFSGNFFYILVVDNYKSGVWQISEKTVRQIIMVNCLVTITKNIFLSFSFFVKEKQEKTDLPFPEDLDLDLITPNQNTV